ncbi:putative N-acetylmannosamine-6-phosphate 2-epimerase [Parasalinivibrio latis]|uniref:N-acetylmannosamine-6-phosphate 2-epimerase n=1 Tax=Parasalinivibrio latis TaxID=2952610 RepID=UPI0030DE69DE
MTTESILDSLEGGLVVSCQPIENGPMDKDDIVVAMAKAAEIGGAAGLRIEGAQRAAKVKSAVSLPIIGIVKRDLPDSDVRITVLEKDVIALADAGVDIIAIDATDRPRPVAFDTLVKLAKSRGVMVMADCSNYDEGIYAAALGCELIGSTLSGYTGGEIPDEPDFQLVSNWTYIGLRVMAEGRYNSTESVGQALKLGAWCCTVGTAITRTETVTEWYVKAAQSNYEG